LRACGVPIHDWRQYMSDLFRAAHGGRPTNTDPVWTPIHIAVGVAILTAMVWRLLPRRAHRALPRPHRRRARRPGRLFLGAIARRTARAHVPTDPAYAVRPARGRRAVARLRRARWRIDAHHPAGGLTVPPPTLERDKATARRSAASLLPGLTARFTAG